MCYGLFWFGKDFSAVFIYGICGAEAENSAKFLKMPCDGGRGISPEKNTLGK